MSPDSFPFTSLRLWTTDLNPWFDPCLIPVDRPKNSGTVYKARTTDHPDIPNWGTWPNRSCPGQLAKDRTWSSNSYSSGIVGAGVSQALFTLGTHLSHITIAGSLVSDRFADQGHNSSDSDDLLPSPLHLGILFHPM